MLVQALKNLSPLALLPPEITGGIALPSGKWGINLAAAELNFPDKGLKVQIPVWSNKNIGDKVELLLNNNVVDQHTITDKVELPERSTLFVPVGRLQSGSWLLAYRVTRLSQAAELFAPPHELDVKLEIPAGQDTDPDYGHSNLYMEFDPKEIVLDGVDKDSAKDGVYILIQAKPGSGTNLPYPNIAVGDVITVSWGGELVLSDPVTQAQIDDPLNNPIKVYVDEAIILKVGDSGLEGLAVTFMVRDRVHNQSEDWCKETRIVVDTGNSRLDAPILEQADGDVLNLDTLGDEELLLLVWAASAEFQQNDVIIMRLRGTTLDGDTIDLKVRQAILKKPPTVVEVLLSNAGARDLAKTQAVFSYELEHDGKIIQNSKGRFINFIGQLKRLLAPIAKDAVGGALKPDLQSVHICIPFDPLVKEGMAIDLKWFGKRPDQTTYDPELERFFPSQEEADDPNGFVITVEGKHLTLLEGGTLELWYILLWEEGDEIVSRESLHAAPLNVGEPQFELVKPIVLGEKDGALEPKDLPGGASKVTCPNPVNNPTKAKDKVTWELRDAAGKLLFDDFKILNSLNAGKAVDFSLNAAFVQQYLEAHRGETLNVSYQIWRAETDGTSYSNPLGFVIGDAVPTLQAPDVDNTVNGVMDPLDPKNHQGTYCRVDVPTPKPDDTVQLLINGTPTFDPLPLNNGRAAFVLGIDFINAHMGKAVVKLSYELIRAKRYPSLVFELTVQKIADEDSRLSMPVIIDHSARDLDVAKLLATDRLSMPQWPLQTKDIPVWLRFDGILANGQLDSHIIWSGQVHRFEPSDLVISLTAAVVAWLNSLKDGSTVTITFAVNVDKAPNAVTKTTFPLRTYTVKALVDEKPTISSVKDSKGVEILEGKDTAERNVTLVGTANKGLKVQILNGATDMGVATADLETGIWTREVSGLTDAVHSFTATALYGSGQVSEPPRTFRVVQPISIYENFESTQPQQILVNKPITFPSGLMFTLSSEGGVNGFYTRIAQDIHPAFGQRTLTFTQRSVGTFSWPGTATTIKFSHYGVNSTGTTVTFLDLSNNPIIEERLQTGGAIKSYVYTAPQGRPVSSFVIKSIESDGGFFMDEITLSN